MPKKARDRSCKDNRNCFIPKLKTFQRGLGFFVMQQPIVIDDRKSDLSKEVLLHSGQDASLCFQCGKCTAGCPVAFAMDLTPNQIMRMVQLGLIDDVLNSQTIRLCAYCSTCSVRCPRNIGVADVMDSLRIMAAERNIPGTDRSRKVNIFNQAFLDTLNMFGRSHAVLVSLLFNLRSCQPFHNAKLGLKMFNNGKIKLKPDRIKGVNEVKEIFQRINRLKKGA
jgi:heterodisulfide reductase subunit C